MRSNAFFLYLGGTAGSVMASRLAEDPAVNVLVLEAGYSDEILASRIPAGYNTIVLSDADWNIATVPQTHAGNRTMMQPRGKILVSGQQQPQPKNDLFCAVTDTALFWTSSVYAPLLLFPASPLHLAH